MTDENWDTRKKQPARCFACGSRGRSYRIRRARLRKLLDATQQGSTFDALTMMGLVGYCTSKLELGIATIPTYPHHPGRLVHQAWTVNVLVGGRVVLGIGPTAELEYEALASNYDKSLRHIRDYLSTVEDLESSDDHELKDDAKASAEIEQDFPEPQPYKVVVSALTPEMRRAAGRAADGVVTWMVSEKSIRNHMVPEITKAAEEAVCALIKNCGMRMESVT